MDDGTFWTALESKTIDLCSVSETFEIIFSAEYSNLNFTHTHVDTFLFQKKVDCYNKFIT